jgi:hypothetical protein
MKREDKKAALAAYKERKAEPGVYVVRCTTTDQIWVGTAPELTAIWNRLSFSLRQGAQTPASLQTAWNAQGADSFTFEPIETLTDEHFFPAQRCTTRVSFPSQRFALLSRG